MDGFKCPICGEVVMSDRQHVDYVYPQAAHLRDEHGVKYGVTCPPPEAMRDCGFWAPCGKPCRTLEERDAHVMEHGVECILLNLLAQGGGG